MRVVIVRLRFLWFPRLPRRFWLNGCGRRDMIRKKALTKNVNDRQEGI